MAGVIRDPAEWRVVREEGSGWCLGEWCAPEAEPEKLPEAFVNTCFYIQGLQALGQITQILHKEEPEWVKDRILTAKKAVMDTFFDANTGDFCGGTGAANAFALNVGLGTAGRKILWTGTESWEGWIREFSERLFY